jgi:two-component system phosphate regulon response regulator PhoB
MPTGTAACDAQPPRILIVDDDADTLTILRFFLRSLQFEVLSAQDGTTAWTLTQECLPDLILTDYQMPEMSGMELARLVRSSARTRHIPILMHSAYDAVHEDVADPLYDDWFEKPTDLMRLGETIRGQIARSHAAAPAG